MQYRREIDGLRAIAVLPVMFFHAGFEHFSGGFVGVDVFFVISGYLITTILLAELARGEFSIVRFYERRARRIMPALFLVMAACLPFAWLWLLPSDMKEFANSLQAVTVFGSNLLFWRESGYFETAAELKPLLHTWSLAVEEQFYVLFPLFLLLTWRFGRRAILVILAVCAVGSLALAHWNILNDLSANFFLLPTRAWELALGAFVAFALSGDRRPAFSPATNQVLGFAGLLLIMYSIFAFSKATPFPGAYALVPTLGTALVILCAGPQTLAGTLLGSRLLVGIGLVSYSAYLWHQPLFAFARHKSVVEPDETGYLALIAAALMLAVLSWRYVERPFRQKGVMTRQQVFALVATGSLAFLAVGSIGQVTGGYYFRSHLEQKMSAAEERIRINFGLDQHCTKGREDFAPACSTSREPEVLLWGDSYAMHLASALLASNPDIKLVQMTSSSCGPIAGIAHGGGKYSERWARECIANNDLVLDYAKRTKSLKYAVISSPFGYVSNAAVRTRDGDVVHGQTVALPAFRETLRALREMGIKPIVVSPPPRSGQNTGRCLVRAAFHGFSPASCDFSHEHALALHRPVLEFLSEIEKEFSVIWLSEAICDQGVCRAAIGDTFIYRDGGHLSHEGSALIGVKMGLYDRLGR